MAGRRGPSLMERYPPDPRGKHVLVYWFMPGYSYLNILTLLYAAVFNLTLLTMVNFVQPYLLEEVLQIPRGEQGALTGFLAALQEVVVISLMGLVGALSDRTGRRVLFSIGFVILALGYFLYPLASSPEQLIAFRVVVAVGAAILPVMLGASLIDFIQECSRGKWLGTTSIFNGLGVILMSIVFGQLPERFEWMGFSGALAGRYTFWIAAAVGIVSAILLRLGFKGGPPPEVKDKPSVLKNFARGITEARRNPRIALAYASGFISRGDLVVVGTFFSLWFVQVGVDQGMTTGQAMGRAAFLFGAVIQLSAICWAYFMGMICDRINRTSAVAIGFGIAAVGYLWLGSIGDPFSAESLILFACIATGIGETSTVVSSAALLGQEAPPQYRGAVVGVYNKSGAIGIMLATIVGGLLVDRLEIPNAPFTMMGLCNLIILLAAIGVRIWGNKPVPPLSKEAA
ncbi:MAG: MFS transporter [Gammaproteobacteria bacterium]|nr:MFS transporter [Gammaproteobacteria bacterium]